MPFAFIYMIALALWVFVACVIWGAAVLLLIIPRVRSIAWPMSLATATTFPFVFAYQLMAIPAIIFILLAAFALWRILEPASAIKNPIVIGGFVFAIIVSGIVMLVASVAGHRRWLAHRLGTRPRSHAQ